MSTKKKQTPAKEKFYVNTKFTIELCTEVKGAKDLPDAIERAKQFKAPNLISFKGENDTINDYSDVAVIGAFVSEF